jgi:hypothetical protein
MLYWLQIQDMALQAAGGKPGPEAAAAAQKLIATLPHSAVLTRLVLLQVVLSRLRNTHVVLSMLLLLFELGLAVSRLSGLSAGFMSTDDGCRQQLMRHTLVHDCCCCCCCKLSTAGQCCGAHKG